MTTTSGGNAPETKISIRPLVPADTARVQVLFEAGMRSMAHLLPSQASHNDLDAYIQSVLDGDLADPYAHYLGDSQKSGFWVATIGDLVVGMAAAYPVPGEPGVIEVFRVSVDQDYRRLGIAGSIMDALESWALAAGYEEAMLHTTAYLTAAHRLYENRGYRLVNSERYGEIEIREYRKGLH